jgi:hypothetical protein
MRVEQQACQGEGLVIINVTIRYCLLFCVRKLALMRAADSLEKRGGKMQKISHSRDWICKKSILGPLSFVMSLCQSAVEALSQVKDTGPVMSKIVFVRPGNRLVTNLFLNFHFWFSLKTA